MINYHLIQFCSYSIVIAVIIGLIRFRKIVRTFQPFIFITIASLANEMITPFMINHFNTNAINSNVANLVDCLLWIWQFKRWGAFLKSSRWKYPAFLVSLSLFWLIENIYLGKITIFSSAFSLMASFTIVFLAIDQVNSMIVEEKKTLLRNSKFLICCGIIIFYTYRIMVESFYLLHLDQSNRFLSNIFIILVYVNLFVNLLFALATLWIPTRQRFTMQY